LRSRKRLLATSDGKPTEDVCSSLEDAIARIDDNYRRSLFDGNPLRGRALDEAALEILKLVRGLSACPEEGADEQVAGKRSGIDHGDRPIDKAIFFFGDRMQGGFDLRGIEIVGAICQRDPSGRAKTYRDADDEVDSLALSCTTSGSHMGNLREMNMNLADFYRKVVPATSPPPANVSIAKISLDTEARFNDT
jgi:hypothetical protein